MKKIGFLPLAILCSTALIGQGCAADEALLPATGAPVSSGMHPSWDADGDGINDCEKDGSCDHTVDYSKPREGLEPAGANPSFNCNLGQLSEAEVMVCNNPQLAGLDQQLSEVYHQAKSKIHNTEQLSQFKAEQRGWVKGRNDCWKADDKTACIRGTYQQRITSLQARYQLVENSGPVILACGGDDKNEFIATWYQTDPPTIMLERGDQSSLLHRVPSETGVMYQGQNETLVQMQQDYSIAWGFEAPVLNCVKK